MSALLLMILCGMPMPDGPPGPVADVRIVFWFDRSRPLDTFRYQVYDLELGQYTPAVDDWLRLLHRDYPSYEAHARDFDLSRARGDTRAHRIGAAIVGEFLAIGQEHGYTFAGFPASTSAGPPRLRPGRPLARPGIVPAPNPSLRPPSFGQAPFPIPYPRPHP